MKQVLAAVTLTVLSATLVQAGEVTWSNTISSIFEKQCIACHGSEAPEYAAFKKDKETWLKKGSGMRMDTYSHLVSFVGWPNTGALMRRLDDGKNSKEGKSGNMYRYLGATEEERQKNLDLFKSWVGNWSLKRLPETSKEDLSRINAAY
jgi:cytochrome c5